MGNVAGAAASSSSYSSSSSSSATAATTTGAGAGQASRIAVAPTRDGLRVVQVGPARDPDASCLTVCVMSDTHGRHRALALPRGGADVLIHAGDHANWKTSARDTRDFNAWLGEIRDRFPVRLVCCGNHELSMDKAGSREERAKMLPNATYCEGETVTVGDGVLLFFAPWTPSRNFTYRANAFQRGKEQLARLLLPCPDNVDVLVTHCPPLGILDMHRKGHHMGSGEVLDCVHRVVPSVHLFGHCHDDSGVAMSQIDSRRTAAARWRYAARKERSLQTGGRRVGAAAPEEESSSHLSSSSVWTCSHCSYANPPLFLVCEICNMEKPGTAAPELGVVRRSSLKEPMLLGVGAAVRGDDGDNAKTNSGEDKQQEQRPLRQSASLSLERNVVFVNASNRQGEQPLLLDIYYYPLSQSRPRQATVDRLRPDGSGIVV
jgi:hypothetical protein